MLGTIVFAVLMRSASSRVKGVLVQRRRAVWLITLGVLVGVVLFTGAEC